MYATKKTLGSAPGMAHSTYKTSKTSFRIVKSVFTLYKIAFAPARKPHRVGDLFTQVKRSGFGAIFVTERSYTALHCTAPISK